MKEAGYTAALLGCRLSGETPALLVPDPPGDPDALLVLRDGARPSYAPTPGLARTLASYAQSGHAGLVCAWTGPLVPFYTELAALLDGACAEQGLPLWMTEPYAEQSGHAKVLCGADVTSGSLSEELRGDAARWPGRCVLALRPLSVRCSLPCPDGGTPIGAEEREALRGDAPVFRSVELGCMYFSRPAPEGEGVELALYDTRETLEAKLRAAEDAGFQAALGPLRELSELPGA